MTISKQGKLGLGLFAGVLLMAVVSTLILALRSEAEPSITVLATSPVAVIQFSTPTEAWISNSGTKALYRDGDTFKVGTYGYEGQTSVADISTVLASSIHSVSDVVGPPALLVIDDTEYTLTDGAYVAGACHVCDGAAAQQVAVADMSDGTWKVTLGDTPSLVTQPAGWDGARPSALVTPDGTVVIVASLGDEGTAVVEGEHSCRLDGQWRAVGAEAQRILLSVVDSAGLDYSVVAVNRCS